jgi:ubiquinone/menaquinone biosynthesis C-methylase UbiE
MLAAMRLKDREVSEALTRREVYESQLPLAHARVLELGCGAADVTREIATHVPGVAITALEVDRVQHETNCAISDLPNVRFKLAGAEAIPAPHASFHIVLMFRSLHHLPVERMDQALREIHRVRKEGGLAYQEPLFDGEYNEIMRVFHDEQSVREAAFLALKRAIASGLISRQKSSFSRRSVSVIGHNSRRRCARSLTPTTS